MTLLSEIIVVNFSPFTKPAILQWSICEERKGYQGKEHDISHCFTKPAILQWSICKERKGYQGKEHDISH